MAAAHHQTKGCFQATYVANYVTKIVMRLGSLAYKILNQNSTSQIRKIKLPCVLFIHLKLPQHWFLFIYLFVNLSRRNSFLTLGKKYAENKQTETEVAFGNGIVNYEFSEVLPFLSVSLFSYCYWSAEDICHGSDRKFPKHQNFWAKICISRSICSIFIFKLSLKYSTIEKFHYG